MLVSFLHRNKHGASQMNFHKTEQAMLESIDKGLQFYQLSDSEHRKIVSIYIRELPKKEQGDLISDSASELSDNDDFINTLFIDQTDFGRQLEDRIIQSARNIYELKLYDMYMELEEMVNEDIPNWYRKNRIRPSVNNPINLF
jgi:hypothetical protein